MGCAGSAASAAGSASLPSFEKYEREEKLGEGAYSQVWAARDRESGEPRALKTRDLGVLSGGPDEAQLWRGVPPHEHCLRLFEAFASKDRFCFVMELCDSSLHSDLSAVRSAGSDETSRVLRETLQGLEHLHDQALVHRDLKPTRILFSGGRRTVKITGFASAAMVPCGGSLSGAVGTAAYMSPEMAADLPYGTATDVWSLGVCAYLLIFGDFPYMVSRDDIGATMTAIRSGAVPPNFVADGLALDADAVSRDADAVALTRMLLTRQQDKRCFASVALESNFLRRHALSGNAETKPNASDLRNLDENMSTLSGCSETPSLTQLFSTENGFDPLSPRCIEREPSAFSGISIVSGLSARRVSNASIRPPCFDGPQL